MVPPTSEPIPAPPPDILRAYAAGQRGTRETIEALGLHDYADLIIALVAHDLPFPKPAQTPAHAERVERARVLLEPLLRRDAPAAS